METLVICNLWRADLRALRTIIRWEISKITIIKPVREEREIWDRRKELSEEEKWAIVAASNLAFSLKLMRTVVRTDFNAAVV